MKKIVLSILVLMLVAPVMAIDVTFTAVNEGTGDVQIWYDANSPPGKLPRAFALDITVDNGQTIDAISNLSADYWVYPGSIDINDAGEVNNVGHPDADPCDLPSDTQKGLGFSGVTIEMGSLYVGGPNAPDPCDMLCKVTVSGDCNLTVTGNVGRGKAVLEGATQALTNLPIVVAVTKPSTFTIAGNVASGAAPIKNMVGVTIAGLPGPPVTDGSGNYTATVNAGFTGTTTVTVAQWSIPGKSYNNVQADALTEDYTATATECYNAAGDGYAFWAANGTPDCWCYEKQCNGDINGKPAFGKRVTVTDNDVMSDCFGLPTADPNFVLDNCICADLNHLAAFGKRVTVTDNTTLGTYFGIADISVPVCADTYINEWKYAP